jgi:WD40 repeat protein
MKKAYLLNTLIIFSVLSLSGQNDNDFILWTADWNAKGSYLAVGGSHGQLKIYKGRKLKLERSIPINGTITRLHWHPQKDILAIATQSGEHPVQVLDLKTNILKQFKQYISASARGLEWSSDGRCLGVADGEGIITIFNEKGEIVNSISKENTKTYTALAWHPKEYEILVVSEYIRHFDIKGKELQKIRHRPEDVLLLSTAWHPSGEFFVSADYGTYGNTRVYPLLNFWTPNGELIKSLNGSIAEYRNIAWSPNRKVLATASDGLRLWNKEGELLKTLPTEALLWGLDWHPRGKRIVTKDENGLVQIWNKKGKMIKSIKYQMHESD